MNKYIDTDLLRDELAKESVPKEMKQYVLNLIDRQEPVDFIDTLRQMIHIQKFSVTVFKKGGFSPIIDLEHVVDVKYMSDSNKWLISNFEVAHYIDNDIIEDIIMKVEVEE